MTPPFLSPIVRSPRRGRLLAAMFVATLAIGALALPSLGKMSDRGTGVIEFEFARTSAKAAEITADWGEEGRDAAREAVWLDYPYLIAYGLLLAAACAVVSDRAARTGRHSLARAAGLLSWAALLAAGCDAVENVGLLRIAGAHTDQPWPGLAFTFASLKFALVVPVALCALVGGALTRSHRS